MTRTLTLVAFSLAVLSVGCTSSTREYLVDSDTSTLTRGVDTVVVVTFEDDVIPTTPQAEVRLFLVDQVGPDADLIGTMDLGMAGGGTTPSGMVTSFEVLNARTIQFGIRLDESLELETVDALFDLSVTDDPHSADRAFGLFTFGVE